MYKKLVFIFFGITLLSGCAKTLNPYADSFACPRSENGKCVSLTQAYEESIGESIQKNKENNSKKQQEKTDKTPSKTDTDTQIKIPEQGDDLYKEALYKKMTKLINDPVTPIMLPPNTLRMLIFPYSVGNTFYMHRFIYFLDDTPRFIFDGGVVLPEHE